MRSAVPKAGSTIRLIKCLSDVRNMREAEAAHGEYLAGIRCAARGGLSRGRPNTAAGWRRLATDGRCGSQFSEDLEAMPVAGSLLEGLHPISPSRAVAG